MGMWPWGKSPDKEPQKILTSRVTEGELLGILTFHLTCDSFAFPHPTVCQALAFLGFAWIQAPSLCPNWGRQMENENQLGLFFPPSCARAVEPWWVGET